MCLPHCAGALQVITQQAYLTFYEASVQQMIRIPIYIFHKVSLTLHTTHNTVFSDWRLISCRHKLVVAVSFTLTDAALRPGY